MSEIQNNPTLSSVEEMDQERPQFPWMIGLLVLLFGALGASVSAMNLYLGITNLGNVRSEWTSVGLEMNYIYFVLVVGIVVSLWMIFIGRMLLKYRDIGRRHFDYYLIYFVLWTLATSLYQYLMAPEGFARTVIFNDMVPELMGKGGMLLLFLGSRYLLNKANVRSWLT